MRYLPRTRATLLSLLLLSVAVSGCGKEAKQDKVAAAKDKKKKPKKAKRKSASTPPTEADFEVQAAEEISESNYIEALAIVERVIAKEQALLRGTGSDAPEGDEDDDSEAKSAAKQDTAAKAQAPNAPATSQSALNPAPESAKPKAAK